MHKSSQAVKVPSYPPEADIRTPVRAYYQYGESPYQSKPKPLKLKVTASS